MTDIDEATAIAIREMQRPLEEKMYLLEDGAAQDTESIRLIHGKIEQVEALIKASLTPPVPDKKEIYTALAKAQNSIQNADQNIENEFLQKKYADLASCLDAVRGPLSDNEIALFQITEDPEAAGTLGIRTVLAHSSGQTIQDVITMSPPKLDPQGIGSCRTYMRRYALLAICGIAGAADDDAENTKKDPNDYDKISAKEIDKILATADDLFKDKADFVIKKMCEATFDISHVSQIKAGEADLAITRLKNTAKREKAAVKKQTKKPSPKPPEQEQKDREPGSDDDK